MPDSLDYRGLSLPGEQSAPGIGGDSYESGIQDDRAAMQEAHRRNFALGLLAAGLSTMGAQPRGWRTRVTPWEALGQGGLTGLETYAGLESDQAKQMMARRKMAIEDARYRAQFAQTQELRDVQKQHEKDWKEISQQTRDTAAAAQKSTDAYHQRMTDLTQQQRNIQEKGLGLKAEEVGIQAGRLGVEQARFGAEYRPLGAPQATAMLKYQGVPNAEQLGPIIGVMPAGKANQAIEATVRNSRKKLTTTHTIDADGYEHIIGIDPETSKPVSDTKLSYKTQPKGRAGGTMSAAAQKEIDEMNRAAGITTPPAETPAGPAPAAATPTPSVTPSPVAAAGSRPAPPPTLPPTIRTTSAAVDYLTKTYGMSRDAAINWIRANHG